MNPLALPRRDVGPRMAAIDMGNHALVDAVVASDSALRFLSLTSTNYFGHIIGRYLGMPILFALRAAAFAPHVLAVVFGRSDKQVVWPHARGIVAVVQAIQALRYGSIGEFVGGTMRELYGSPFASTCVDAYAPVAVCAYTSCPDPTPVCFLDLGP
jgi:hypothetical protein